MIWCYVLAVALIVGILGASVALAGGLVLLAEWIVERWPLVGYVVLTTVIAGVGLLSLGTLVYVFGQEICRVWGQ